MRVADNNGSANRVRELVHYILKVHHRKTDGKAGSRWLGNTRSNTFIPDDVRLDKCLVASRHYSKHPMDLSPYVHQR
jgi:hypothetical protein